MAFNRDKALKQAEKLVSKGKEKDATAFKISYRRLEDKKVYYNMEFMVFALFLPLDF